MKELLKGVDLFPQILVNVKLPSKLDASQKQQVREISDKYYKGTVIRIYNEHVFFFNKKSLITVYHIPNELRKYLYIRKRKRNEKV